MVRPQKWLRRLFGRRVISRREMREMDKVTRNAPDGVWVSLPETLWPAAERISLYRQQGPSKMLH